MESKTEPIRNSSRINGFEFHNQDFFQSIGSGAFARILKCQKHGKIYACKIMEIEKAISIKAIENEYDVMAKVNEMDPICKKYTLKIHGKYQQGNSFYIFMDYCEEGDLGDFLSKKVICS